jgi:RHH-type transcriptional regulator, rel operon repressor / antitoxin RelB
MLDIRVPDSNEKRLAKLAKRTGRTKTFYAREAILRHPEDLEDAYDADVAWERIQSGKDKPIPLDEVMKGYGMDR